MGEPRGGFCVIAARRIPQATTDRHERTWVLRQVLPRLTEPAGGERQMAVWSVLVAPLPRAQLVEVCIAMALICVAVATDVLVEGEPRIMVVSVSVSDWPMPSLG